MVYLPIDPTISVILVQCISSIVCSNYLPLSIKQNTGDGPSEQCDEIRSTLVEGCPQQLTDPHEPRPNAGVQELLGVRLDMLEHEIRRSQKLDTVSTISSLRLTSTDLSRMKVLLCWMVPMPMIRPTLSCDLVALEQESVHGYEEGAHVFYVSVSDEQGQRGIFNEAEKREWGPLWSMNLVNDEFNLYLRSTPLKHLVDHKFFVCDGNHRTIAWMNHIKRLHSTEINWHISVDTILLDTKDRISVAMQAMHDINK